MCLEIIYLTYMYKEDLAFFIYIYGLFWFDFVLWHINHFRVFNAKSSLYIYIRYI